MRFASLSLGFAILAVSAALASDDVVVRTGAHPGFARVVFEWPSVVAYTIERDSGRIRVRFDREGRFAPPTLSRSLPTPILGVQAEGAEAIVTVAEGATARHYRLDRRIVLDVSPGGLAHRSLPTAAALATPIPALPVPPPWPKPSPDPGPVAADAVLSERRNDGAAPSSALRPATEQHAEPDAQPQQSSPASAPAEAGAASVGTVGQALQTEERGAQAGGPTIAGAGRGGAQPVSLLVRPSADRDRQGIVLPFPPTTGFAVFRRGGALWLVADEPRPLDVRRLRGHPVFGEVEVTLTPTATLLRLPNLADVGLHFERVADGVEVRPTQPAQGGATATMRHEVVREGGRMQLRLGAAGANRVLRLIDPETGEPLLIGTMVGDSSGVAIGRSGAEFSLLRSDRGVVVLAWSENVQLSATPDGFRLEASPHLPEGLALSSLGRGSDFALASRAPTRSFDLPVLPAEAMAERLRLLRAEVARVGPLARSRARVLLSETMLAAGLGAEAHALLTLAAAEDPALASSPHWKALAGAAALVASRLGEARTLLHDSAIPQTDEIVLWRTWLAHEDGAPPDHTAARFAATAPLIVSYPRELSRRLVPAAIEAMIDGGEADVAEALLRRFDDWPELTLARAMLLEHRGEIDQALAEYAQTATLRDRWQRARGIWRGTELALREGRLGVPEAAARLEPLLYAWRGDGWERKVRFRAAELRAAAGDWAGAIALLRETGELFPEAADDARARLVDLFGRLFRDGLAENLIPSQAISLFEENLDLLPAGSAGDDMVARFAERLVALELTTRAAALLARLMEGQVEGSEDRARAGLRLARLRLDDGDAAGALAALAASEPLSPPPGLAVERAILKARALAAAGAVAEARKILRGLSHRSAREAAADLAFATGNWAEATAILTTLLQEEVPASSELGPAQRQLVLRGAVAAVLADDQKSLAWLQERYGAAMADGALSEPFRLLSSDGATPSTQTRQLAAELQLARAVQRSLGRPSTTSRD